MKLPDIITETSTYIVLYKPHKMHTVPIKADSGGTLLDWAAQKYPELLKVHGKKDIEGGILHRLDYETAGLVLAARTQEAYNNLYQQQNEGLFVKEYDALCAPPDNECKITLCGFPPPPKIDGSLDGTPDALPDTMPFTVSSYFRHYGAGRKSVRPLLDADGRAEGGIYTTEVLSISALDDSTVRLRVRIDKGFMHQIRCHLAWLGFPILNDTLYGGKPTGGELALNATRLYFTNPQTGRGRRG
jgi:23S rRNA pseudouridine1911/1915/1917 synthase